MEKNFNSHARVGRDFEDAGVETVRIISTHTPAWGVTLPSSVPVSCGTYFNSHARVGRDHLRRLPEPPQIDFNSHARVGRDKYHFRRNRTGCDFNSHARVGRDPSG